MKLRCWHCYKVLKLTFRISGNKESFCSLRCMDEFRKKHVSSEHFDNRRKEHGHG